MRRLCVLLERGEESAADSLEAGPVADLIASMRAETVNSAEFDQRLQSVFATEQERIANASALAELLLPLLSSAAPIFGVAKTSPAPAVEQPNSLATSFPPPIAPTRRAPGDIADFLDDMIAQEQAETAPGVPKRRAS